MKYISYTFIGLVSIAFALSALLEFSEGSILLGVVALLLSQVPIGLTTKLKGQYKQQIGYTLIIACIGMGAIIALSPTVNG